MTTSYSPTATQHATITTPDDGDEPSGALFATPLEQLADNIAYEASIRATYSEVEVVASATANDADFTNTGTISLEPGLYWVHAQLELTAAGQAQLTFSTAAVFNTHFSLAANTTHSVMRLVSISSTCTVTLVNKSGGSRTPASLDFRNGTTNVGGAIFTQRVN